MARWTDALLAAGWGGLAFATRWSLRGHDLFSWDSGMLASGILSYDFRTGYPHPPYYPLTIAAGKVLAPWTGPTGALVVLAIFASGVLAAFTYLAARAFCGRAPSAAAAGLVVLSPVALFNGIAPLTYALEGASSAVVAWAAWRVRARPTVGRLALLASLTSFAIGIRPSSVFLVAPLAVWAIWRNGRAAAWGAGIGAAGTVAWLVPAIVAGGGIREFLSGIRYQGRFIVFAHTILRDGWRVVPENASRIAASIPVESPFLEAAAVLAVVTALGWWPLRARAPAGSFLAAWLAPSLGFFLFLYAGWPVYPSGYVLVLVPAVAVSLAWVGEALAKMVITGGAPIAARGLLSIVAVAVLVMPMAWPGQWPAAVSGQREADSWVTQWWALSRQYPANETALLTYYAWFWCRLDHPEYMTWGLQPYWTPAGAIQVQVVQTQHLEDEPHAFQGPAPSRLVLHRVPAWVKHIIVVYGPPSRGAATVLKPEVPAFDRTLDSGMHVTVLDPADVPSIEQVVRWFDPEGRPIPA